MMNKDEAVQKLSKVARISVAYAEDLYDSFFEKPVVPQYVADWYEEHKDDFEIKLFQCICEAVENYDKNLANDFENWLMSEELEVIQTLVNMHQFGYEVEKGPRYTVRIKGIDGYSKYLNRDAKTQTWFFASKTELERFRAHHTRKELEANDFGWVFDCPGVEVKEVE
jgi:gp178|nr:MAG TPA: Protein of unknown function (DUF1642) [Caudoviricetes sp.]